MFPFGSLTGKGRKQRKLSGGRHEKPTAAAWKTRLRFEPLEERRLLTVITVNDLGDGPPRELGTGAITLRDAILAANLDTPVGNAPAGHHADTIQFAPGLSGTITLTAGELTIDNPFEITNNDLKILGPGSTKLTIDADGNSRIFTIYDSDDDSNSNVAISGMTLTGGQVATHGGAIVSGENLQADDLTIVDNAADQQGGGLWITPSSGGVTTIRNSIISGNTAGTVGGGIAINGDDHVTTTIQDSLISGNTAGGSGGGIYHDTIISSNTTIERSTIRDNTAGGDGGGVFANTVRGSSASIVDSTLFHNIATSLGATSSGGGIASTTEYDSTLSIDGCTITNNQADLSGGGIDVDSTAGGTLVQRSTVSGNTAHFGGGIHANLYYSSSLSVQESTISDNTALGDGGGLHVTIDDPLGEPGALFTLQDSTVSGNEAGIDGGGIWSYTYHEGTTTIQQSTISGNTALNTNAFTDSRGGGIYAKNYGELFLRNSTITGNKSDNGGGGVYLYTYNEDSTGEPTTPAVIQSTIIAGNEDASGAGPDLFGEVNMVRSLVGDRSDSSLAEVPLGAVDPSGRGNLVGDPMGSGVIDAKLGPLTNNGGPTETHALLAASPAINTGLNPTSATSDQRGLGFARVVDGQTDMGAYEVAPATLSPEIAVLQGITSIVSEQPTAIDFGSQKRGTIGVSKTFTIRNEGEQTLTLNVQSFVDTAHFIVSRPSALTLAPNANTTFTVQLKTDAIWSGFESISIGNNDGDNGDGVENPFTFSVAGDVLGMAPEITLLHGTAVIPDGWTIPIDIGMAAQGAAGPSKTFTIRNDGDDAMELFAASFVDTAHFSVSQPGSLILAAGATTTFTVTLKTNAQWSGGSESISFANNDADNGDGLESPYDFLVTGRVAVTTPEIVVLDGAIDIVNGQTAPVDFGTVFHGDTPPSKVFTIRNVGDQLLTLDAASFVDTAHFAVSLPGALSLTTGASTTFTATLKTDAAWSGAELISLVNNDGDNGDGVENPFTFQVSGTVAETGAEITVLDGTTVVVSRRTVPIKLGTAVHNEIGPSKTFTIRNDGDLPLVLDTNSFADTLHFTVSQPGAASLLPGASTTFTVTLKTGTVWSGSEYIAFNSNDANGDGKVENPFKFRVGGTVTKTAPEITLLWGATEVINGQAQPVTVGSAQRNTAGPSITLTVRNDGDQTLKLTSPIIDPAHFSVSRLSRTSLAPGKTSTFTITLKTDALWSGSEPIALVNTDGDNGDGVENPFTFNVAGAVTAMPQELTVLDGGESMTNGQTSAIQIGSAARDTVGPSTVFTIRNDGDQTLLLTTPFANTPHFLVSQPGKSSLLPGETTTFTVTLNTSQLWTGSEYVAFGSNDADNGDGIENPFSFRVSGSVTRLDPEITILNGTNVITDGQTTPIDLGSAVRTTVASTLTFTIRNDGDRTLTLTKPFASTPHFAVGQPGRTTLSPGSSTTFTVTMDTYEVWSGAEQITLLNTDADNGDGTESPFTFTVGGTVSQPAHDLGTVGEYDPTKSIFYLRSSNQSGVADLSVLYGPARSGWTPLAGDWDGNGIDTVGLYDPVAARFYLRDSNTAGFADMMFDYGLANGGWIPLAGDWNGDGQETVGLYNPTTSAFYLKNSNTGGFADVSFVYGPAQGGWKPVGGDWDGDGVDTIGLYNPTTAVFYLRNSNTTGYAETAFNYGPNNSGWTPLIGDWDGDGIDSAALHDAATSTFYLRYSNDQGTANAAFDFDGARHTWLPVTGVWTVGNALLADELPATASADAAVLSRAELQPVIVEATARWTATGLDASSLAKLAQVQFIIADLPDLHLGTATANRVYVDINGAGHGWFVDPTPGQDEEFATAGVAGPLRAVDARALDRIDLLTVVEHELGHILGLADVDALAESVMQNVLAAGLRRQP